jgi:hypothetical protein
VRLANLLKLLATLLVGGALGLAATWASVARGVSFGAVSVGPWVAFPRTGARDRDPYAAAALARSGEIPLDLAEGLAFHAHVDSDGAPLAGGCVYRLEGPAPPARFWTITALDARGFLLDNPAGRHGFTSTEMLRAEDGGFEIVIAPSARAGVWLPGPRSGAFTLALRLYDTPVAAVAGGLTAAGVPSIRREGCG